MLKGFNGVKKAEESDWGKEYLDLIIGVKIVSGVEEAIEHINKYEPVIRSNSLKRRKTAREFLNKVDATAVAGTRPLALLTEENLA